MKVRKRWTCRCGETTVYDDLETTPPRVIAKGDCYHQVHAGSSQSFIRCGECHDGMQLMPIVVKANDLKKVWRCNCGETDLLKTEEGNYLIRGKGFAAESPPTHIRCLQCGSDHRVCRDLQFYDHLKKVRKAHRKAS